MNNRERRAPFHNRLTARINRTADASASAMQTIPIAVSRCGRPGELLPFLTSAFNVFVILASSANRFAIGNQVHETEKPRRTGAFP